MLSYHETASGVTSDAFFFRVSGAAGNAIGTVSFQISISNPNHAPVMTVASANVPANAGQSLRATSLFSATDADNDTLSYDLYDNSPAANSGHFVVNGAVVLANTVYEVSAAHLRRSPSSLEPRAPPMT